LLKMEVDAYSYVTGGIEHSVSGLVLPVGGPAADKAK
jgi:hypothetical protein